MGSPQSKSRGASSTQKSKSQKSKVKPKKTAPKTTPPEKKDTQLAGNQSPHSTTESDLNAVGHHPSEKLTEGEQKRFLNFQANLLSLISHELRTPLMGILNALTLLDSEELDPQEASTAELFKMARRNAQNLHHSLSSLLDLAQVESGTFHARLKEVDLARLVARALHTIRTEWREHGIKLNHQETEAASDRRMPVLADPQKLLRALELCFYALSSRAEPSYRVKIEVGSFQVTIEFLLKKEREQEWKDADLQAQIGFKSGVSSPGSAFADVLKSPEEFLTRSREGLGSEFLIIHEIMKLHDGTFELETKDRSVRFQLTLPRLSSRKAIESVLSSRVFGASTGLGHVGFALIAVPEKQKTDAFRREIQKCLFRASDAVYALEAEKLLALVMDDCKKEDAPKLIKRIEGKIKRQLQFGVVSCPDEGTEPEALFHLALSRLNQ